MELFSEIKWTPLAKFPFLDEAKEKIIQYDLTLFNILKEYPEVLDLVSNNFDLILTDIDKFAEKKIGEAPFFEFLSYSIQNALISFLNDTWFTRRYTEAFAKRTRLILKNYNEENIINQETIIKLIKDLGAVIYQDQASPPTWMMKIPDYLSAISRMKYYLKDETKDRKLEKKWKLVNRQVSEGYVRNLDGRDLHQIFEEVLRHIINQKILKIIEELEQEDLPKQLINIGLEFKARLNDIKKERRIGEYYSGNIYNEAFPGCINKLFQKIMEGRNLSNDERLVIEFFLLNIGVKKEELLKLFAHSPDFKLEKTEYFIDHAIKKGYTSFGCKRIKSYGICTFSNYTDPYKWCENNKIKNPINFFRRMVWMLENLIFPQLLFLLPQFLCFPFSRLRNIGRQLKSYLKKTRRTRKSKNPGRSIS